MKTFKLSTLAVSLSAALLATSAHAVLERVGPTVQANGFPAWYQDRNGIALELCSINAPDPDISALIISSALCPIANAPAPDGINVGPEVFPNNFTTEHFYTLLGGNLTTAGSAAVNAPPRVVFNMGLEASFSNGVPTPGTQVMFSRWRVQHFGVACTGPHTYYTPTNTPQTFDAVAGGRVFQTYDVGLTNPADVLTGHTGPFIEWSDTPGGTPKAPFIGPDNKKYMSNSAETTLVTGSLIPNALLNSSSPLVPPEIKEMPMTNYVAVMGPGVVDGNCLETQFVSTTQFSLFGRYFEGAIASRNSVDRATYDGNGTPETFQIGTWTTGTQEAGAPVPQMSARLWYSDPLDTATSSAELAMAGQAVESTTVPPAGVIATPTFHFFSGATSPTQVSGTVTQPGPVYTNDRVRVLTDNPVSTQDVALVDEVRITQAAWNATTKTLTVAAESGAYLQTATPTTAPLPNATNSVCSIPCLRLDNFGLPLRDVANAAIDYKMKTVAGTKAAVATIVVPNVQTPPPYVRVNSSSGGAATQAVRFLAPITAAASLTPDTLTIPSGTPVAIDILGNDIGVAAAPALTICTRVTAGTCAVPNPATACVLGTASPQCTALGGRISLVGNTVAYIPPLNTTGVTDTFYYQATTIAGTAARALVTVDITTVANAPDAVDDVSAVALTGRPVTIDVAANDLAAALLADRHGVIDIDLPVSGSLSDPEFRLGPIVFKLIVNLVVKAVTAPFSLLANMLGGGGEELSVVNFASGSATLSIEARAGLDKVAKALLERPALNMTVAGSASLTHEREAYKRAQLQSLVLAEKRRGGVVAGASAEQTQALTVSEQDYPALLKAVYKRADFPKPRNLIGLVKDIPVPEMEALLLANLSATEADIRALAEQRGVAVRDYLASLKLPMERLFLGAAKAVPDDDKWQPRAELNLATR